MEQQGALAMSGESVSTPIQTSLPTEGGEEMMETRFGKVKIFRQNPIVFPNGLLGMPDKLEFCLTSFPSEKLNARFKLLQSLEDEKLSFMTLPLDVDNNIIERVDLEQGCKDLDLDVSELAILLIVSVHREHKPAKVSVNSRAPLLLNAPKRVATQYVFHNNKYKIRHMLNG